MKYETHYGIEAKNYGFYVYRSKRLITWADRLNGIIPNDRDLHSPRGRIVIHESADEVLNINTKRQFRLVWPAADALVECCSFPLQKAKHTIRRIENGLPRADRPDALAIANSLAAQLSPVARYRHV